MPLEPVAHTQGAIKHTNSATKDKTEITFFIKIPP
jgi:hypothetical protein